MTIGDFSSRCGLSPKVLRAYADAGVLVRLDLRHHLREAVTGCHVGFMMSKRFTDRR